MFLFWLGTPLRQNGDVSNNVIILPFEMGGWPSEAGGLLSRCAACLLGGQAALRIG
jgi:hypothetical protein